jgi:hypothetical protein
MIVCYNVFVLNIPALQAFTGGVGSTSGFFISEGNLAIPVFDRSPFLLLLIVIHFDCTLIDFEPDTTGRLNDIQNGRQTIIPRNRS